MNKRWPLLSSVLCASLLISACSADATVGTVEREAISVEVSTATNESLDAISSLSGTLQPYEEVDLSFQLGGIIANIGVEVGDEVFEGATLANLIDTDYQLQVDQAEHTIAQAQASVTAAEAAVKSSSVSIESAEASLAAANAQINSAQAGLAAVLDGARKQEKAQAKLAIDSAQTAYDNAKINAERMKVLYDGGLVSKQEYESAELALSNANIALKNAKESYSLILEGATEAQIKQSEATVESAKAGKTQANTGISQADAAKEQASASKKQAEAVYNQALTSKEQAEQTLAKTLLEAPMSGVVLNKLLSKGDYVSPGTSVLTIGDTSQLKVLLPVPDSEIKDWKVGDEVSVILYEQAKTGTVNTIYPQTNDGTGTVSVEVVIPNENSEWLPGQIVKANRMTNNNKGILVPIEAVISNGITSYVFKNVDGVAIKAEVETGAMVNNKIHITKGVEEGDQVVVSGGTLLLDGDPLKIDGGKDE